ncbi:pyruvate:ferredoxin (flavodoxin) oxidoreductase [Candidatus Woesearchaeota archaeon]|nr:pyruvate:ferredoxin (flavodoxin) oxidoreductase [Candidatus Woesearchaeota archaeon]
MVKYIVEDGNSAAANIAYVFSEVAAIYPITPSSPMGELADMWSAKGKKNLFGECVEVVEMQSEGGAAGAIHGSLTAGALTTTFTASQGLLLMIPNMYKIAGEMMPTVFHVSARSLAAQSLSIFGDHSDVMAIRDTGFAIIAANSVQEVQDLAVVSHLATLEAHLPFLNFFDGFRTSHEIQKIELIEDDVLKSMLNHDLIAKFRDNKLTPEKPKVKVGAENPDVYFQGRETVNKYYDATPAIIQKYMDLVKEKTGRAYKLYDYIGAPDADKIIISMGSGCETIEETIDFLVSKGQKVGALKVRLYRPFSVKDFQEAIPATVKKIAVLDRTKEPGSIGEPLYLDTVAALKDRKDTTIVGGRYGLSSKEFTPSMVNAVYKHLDGKCTHNFTVGIIDDVTKLSLDIDEHVHTEPKGVVRCKFWGYGSDGTVSSCKNSIKIIGEGTDMFAQGYFSYDSKKAGGITVSHLRFGKNKIQSAYLLDDCDFVALHTPEYIGRYNLLDGIVDGGTFIINCQWKPEDVFENLTGELQKIIIDKKLKVYCIDALKISDSVGLGHRINTAMQAAFFKVSGVLPEDKAIEMIKDHVKKQFSHKGEKIVAMNWECIDKARDALYEVKIPQAAGKCAPDHKLIPDDASDFAKNVIEPVMRLKGDGIAVSQMPLDGSVPLGTAALEKRGVAVEMPEWIPENCIQCGMCSFVCPHATIRTKQIHPDDLKDAPESFTTLQSNTKNNSDLRFRVQLYCDDCVGCSLCAEVCPTKNKALVMKPASELRTPEERANYKFFDKLPNNVIEGAIMTTVKGTQLLMPYFEFSGACAGCGETPYYRLLTQFFGDRMIIANATGCSSIYGGTFPTTPFTTNEEGKGPAWANSLFEDNAEYGFGFRLAIDAARRQLKSNINALLKSGTTVELKAALEKVLGLWDKVDDDAKAAAKEVVKQLPAALEVVHGESEPLLRKVDELKDYLVDKSVWIIGGDGWAYDIGFGGLDHVLASGKNVNVLVLDTEVYSNTGGQASKATPRAATAKFATAGKPTPKKNLGLMMMSYGNVYVASCDMGGNKSQVIKAMQEAEAFNGPSIIIAYSPCIAHGYNLKQSDDQAKRAAQSGYWPIYRYNPSLEKPFSWDSMDPKLDFNEYILNETRYKSLKIAFPDHADELFKKAKQDAKDRFSMLKLHKE